MIGVREKNATILVFGQTSSDRDFLRDLLGEYDHRIITFDNESICFDNLASIEPHSIVLKTDSHRIIWRFIFALRFLQINAKLIILSNVVRPENIDLVASTDECFIIAIQEGNIGHRIEKALSRRQPPNGPKELIVGETAVIKKLRSMLPRLARSFDPVLIKGEPGTGKEMLARMILNHAASDALFVKINCGAIKPNDISNGVLGKNRRTCMLVQNQVHRSKPIHILLDRINLLNQAAQSEVLLLLEQGSVSNPKGPAPQLRIIATSEIDLSGKIQQRTFRQDLFYRLNVISLYMPPLRSRKMDIPLLMDYFAIEACCRLNKSFILPSECILDHVVDHNWPGNLDEMKFALYRFAISKDENQIFAHMEKKPHRKNGGERYFPLVYLEVLPDSMEIQQWFLTNGGSSLKAIRNRFACRTEKELMRKALEVTKWNRKKAAALLNISYKSMLNKMKLYRIA